MPRKGATAITFQPSDEEREILELYCKQVDLTKSAVLRELIRGLKSKLKTAYQPSVATNLDRNEKI